MPDQQKPRPGSFEDSLRALDMQLKDAEAAVKEAKTELARELFKQQLELLRRRRQQHIANPSGVPFKSRRLKPIRRP